MDHSQTIRALANITDAGLFERLATAVLRQAAPGLYGGLSHPGMNTAGRTRRSPVDGIAFVSDSQSAHMVIAHHASGAGEDLRKKWLNDPAKVKKRGPKPTAPAGDVIKTVRIVEEERKRTAALTVTLALTTNQEPAEDLTRDVQATANQHGITIDVWSASRLAHYLDNTPDGQWLRYKYLDVNQERISSQLLAELSCASLGGFSLMTPAEGLIERELDHVLAERSPLPVTLLVGPSGSGKTIACYRLLRNHIEAGGFGLVLTHETLATCATLDLAIEAELRKLHTSLEPHAGEKARSLCSAERPFVVMVEDINWSERPSLLLEKLVAWARRPATEPVERLNWRLLCPVWPGTMATASDEAKKRLDALSVVVDKFSDEEAQRAVKRRGKLANKRVSTLAAGRIAEALGNDPLLIALHDFDGEQYPVTVIGDFVDSSLQRISEKSENTVTEFQEALRVAGREMLLRRQIDPTWAQVREWLGGEPEQLNTLRQIVKKGEIVRLGRSGADEQLLFRHDRVRGWLLADTAADLMRKDLLSAGTMSEPFFADVIGNALAHADMPEQKAETIAAHNPLALFYALKNFGEPEAAVHTAVLKAIDAWLSASATHSRANRSLRWAALQVLSETESSHVISIADRFSDETWSVITARFLNGDLLGGTQLCLRVGPGSNAPWRDRQIEHAKNRFGSTLTSQLHALLRQSDLSEEVRIGGLRLAGHLAESTLSDAIAKCWAGDQTRSDHLADYLWAAAQCGGDEPARLLRPICAAWAALPDDREERGLLSPRERLGTDHLSWAFNEALAPATARYFAMRARRKDLRWPLTLMLRGVNQPDAVEFIAREFASHSRSGNGYWTLPGDVERNWERGQSELGKPMRIATRERLFKLWSSVTNDKHLRRTAFRLWAANTSEEDVEVMRQVARPNQLADEILKARMRRGDPTAIPAFVQKLQADQAGYWWQLGRDTWCESLTLALGDELRSRGERIGRDWDSQYGSDWITSELIVTRLNAHEAERLLQENWEHLRFSADFIEAALYIATTGTRTLVAETMSACPDPRRVFRFSQFHFHPKSAGGPGLERIAQVEAYVPYLDWLDSFAIFTLWETCNRLGWFAFRRQHLDARLDKTFRERTLLDELGFFKKVDDDIARGGIKWADFLIDRYLEQTDRIEDILDLLEKWLGERMSVAAFEFVAAVLSHVGTRRHLQLLSVNGIEPRQDIEYIRADTTYAVRRRSLT